MLPKKDMSSKKMNCAVLLLRENLDDTIFNPDCFDHFIIIEQFAGHGASVMEKGEKRCVVKIVLILILLKRAKSPCL
jgi:hypothetical protein